MMVKNLQETELFKDEHKEMFEYFLMKHAAHFTMKGSNGAIVIRDILGDNQEEFSKKLDIAMQGENVSEFLYNQKRFGHRGQTSQEIINEFQGKIQPRAIYEQLRRLVKHKEVIQHVVKVGKHDVILFSSS